MANHQSMVVLPISPNASVTPSFWKKCASAWKTFTVVATVADALEESQLPASRGTLMHCPRPIGALCLHHDLERVVELPRVSFVGPAYILPVHEMGEQIVDRQATLAHEIYSRGDGSGHVAGTVAVGDDHAWHLACDRHPVEFGRIVIVGYPEDHGRALLAQCRKDPPVGFGTPGSFDCDICHLAPGDLLDRLDRIVPRRVDRVGGAAIARNVEAIVVVD